MEIKTYTETLTEEDNRTVFSLEPNTILIFKSYRLKDYMYSVYAACLIRRDSITPNNILATLNRIEKKSNIPDLPKIKKSLQKLLDKKYLTRHKDGSFSIVAQARANIQNMKKFRIQFLNFYDSVFKISKWQLEYYRDHSKDSNLRDFFFGELLSRTYFEVPTTYEKIKKDLLLTRHDIKKLTEIKSKPYHINHYDKNDTSFYNINLNYSCIGKKYQKDFYATKLKISPHVKDKMTYFDQNILDRWGDVMNHSEKVVFIKELAGLKNNGSLSAREIATRYPAFFSKSKRDWFLPRLSEKLVINGLKKNDFTRKKVVRQDKDMLWWRDQKDLENYQHPFKYDAPLEHSFHVLK